MDAAATLDGLDTPGRLRIARTLSRQGLPSRAYALALDVYESARQDGDELLAAESADCLAYCSMMTAQYEAGIRFARFARGVWQARGRTAEEAFTSGVLALLFAWIGEPEAVTEAEAGLFLAERCGDTAALVWGLQAKCLASVLLKQPERGMPFGQQAVALSREAGLGSVWSYLGLAEATVWCSLTEAAGGSISSPDCVSPSLRAAITQAIDYTREALGLARAQGDGWLERLMINNIAEYSLYVGDSATADAALAEFAGASGEPTPRCRATHLLMAGRSLVARGRPEEALRSFTEARALLASDDLELASMCQGDLADTLARLGRFEAALAAHRSYHALSLRRASEAADRRARLYAVQWETEALRATASQALSQASNLAASNEALSREAERLLRASQEDPLTGLSNRRQLEVAFLDLLTTGARFSLAMIDVDRFKQVNDRFSHPLGDVVLRRISALLTSGTRSEDLVVRYGGEEFAVLLRGADQATAEHICERLRHSVASHAWSTLTDGLAVTISIGLAASHEAASPDGVLALADRRLYRAKQDGRDRLVSGP